MSLSPEIIHRLAQELEKAESNCLQIAQISQCYPEVCIDDAYAIQRSWVNLKTENGVKIIGHKIGLTSKVMQRASNITEPDTGVLFDYMKFYSGAELNASAFIEPRIEVELAFQLKSDLPHRGCSLQDVLDATEFVIPALELIDSRMPRIDPKTGQTRKVYDTISDNAANAAIILSNHRFKPLDLDLKWLSALLYRNGEIEESGVAAAVLGHPANGIVWLANRLGGFGETLLKGQIVLAGSFTAPIAVSAGDTFVADYGPLKTIEVSFI